MKSMEYSNICLITRFLIIRLLLPTFQLQFAFGLIIKLVQLVQGKSPKTIKISLSRNTRSTMTIYSIKNRTNARLVNLSNLQDQNIAPSVKCAYLSTIITAFGISLNYLGLDSAWDSRITNTLYPFCYYTQFGAYFYP